MNQIDLNGKNAVIIGGGRGMGFSIAARFLEPGASVSLWDMLDYRSLVHFVALHQALQKLVKQ